MVERSYVSCIVGEDSNATYHTHTSHKRRSSPLTKKNVKIWKNFLRCLCICCARVNFLPPTQSNRPPPTPKGCDNLTRVNLPCDNLSIECLGYAFFAYQVCWDNILQGFQNVHNRDFRISENLVKPFTVQYGFRSYPQPCG